MFESLIYFMTFCSEGPANYPFMTDRASDTDGCGSPAERVHPQCVHPRGAGGDSSAGPARPAQTLARTRRVAGESKSAVAFASIGAGHLSLPGQQRQCSPADGGRRSARGPAFHRSESPPGVAIPDGSAGFRPAFQQAPGFRYPGALNHPTLFRPGKADFERTWLEEWNMPVGLLEVQAQRRPCGAWRLLPAPGDGGDPL